MRCSFGWALALALVALPCRADRVVLKSGAEITGVVMSEERTDYPSPGTLVSVTVALRNGGVVTIRGEDVVLIDREEKTRWQEYEERSEQAADDPEARLALAEWCRERGLLDEAGEELLRVLILSPDDPRAEEVLRKLGWKQVGTEDGSLCWISPKEIRKREGHGGHGEPPGTEGETAAASDQEKGTPPDQGGPPPDAKGQVVDGGKMVVGPNRENFSRWKLAGGDTKPDEAMPYGWGRYRLFQWWEPGRRPKKEGSSDQR